MALRDKRSTFHIDGHRPDTLLYNFFLNVLVLVPLVRDVPTVFRDPHNKIHVCPTCGPDMIRIFNGVQWHAGDANNTGNGVWKIFLGLVPGNHPSAGDFPILENTSSKSLREEKGRIVLVADDM
jgi:hypothetical protein